MTYERSIFLQFDINVVKREGRINKPFTKSQIINNQKLMKDLGNGDVAKGKWRFNQLIKRKFYWVQDLEDIEFYVLILYGYVKSKSRGKDKKLIVRDEKGHFEYVLCLLPNNESMQHMRDKEFIASLNYDLSKKEYLISETKNRVDIMFDLYGTKIGIEIQKSLLEYSRLKNKVNLLDRYFDYWLLIVPEKYVEKYSHLSNDNGEVVTMSEAIKKIKFLLAQNPEFFKENS